MRWIKRLLVTLLILLALGVTGFFVLGPSITDRSMNRIVDLGPHAVTADAAALHQTLIVGDWHADSLLWNRDLTQRNDRGHVDFPRLLEGNVAVQVFTAVTKSPAGQRLLNNSADTRDNVTLLAIGQRWPVRTWTSLLERALYQSEKLHAYEQQLPDTLKIIRTRADLEAVIAARRAGQKLIGGILGIEGGHPLEGQMVNLDKLAAAGYRLIGLQHFFDNELGGSLHGNPELGLTAFGRQVVGEIVKRGFILDLAHSSPAVARDVIAMTDIPLVVSHTGVYGYCPSHRNFKDDLMQDIVRSGGVIGIGYWKTVVCKDISPAGIAKMVVKAIDILGEDHISLGSDYDGTVATSFDTSELAALTSALLEAGLTETQIRKVMGDNMLRVLRARLP